MYEAPQLQDVMSVDAWLQVRPQEWGLTTPSPQVALANAVDLHTANKKAFYPRLLTDTWNKRSLHNLPGSNVLFGPSAINCAAQGWLDSQRWPRLRYQQYVWARGNEPSWSWPNVQPVPAQHENYHDLGVYRPCTILSYDYVNECVLAPALMVDDDNEMAFVGLRNSSMARNPTIGLFKGGRPAIVTHTTGSSSWASTFYQDRGDFERESASTVPIYKPGPSRLRGPTAYEIPGPIRHLYTDSADGKFDGGIVVDVDPVKAAHPVAPVQQEPIGRATGQIIERTVGVKGAKPIPIGPRPTGPVKKKPAPAGSIEQGGDVEVPTLPVVEDAVVEDVEAIQE